MRIGIWKMLVLASTLSLGLVTIYGQHFFPDRLIKYDDPYVVAPIQGVKTLNEYIHGVKTGAIPDLQPVRDLSFKVNFILEDLTGQAYFHQLNVLFFLFALIGIFVLLSEWFPGSKTGNFILVHILGFSPLYVSSVAWITARKHVLALMFIVWATVFLLKAVKGVRSAFWLFTLLFALSVLSQPMNLLWPIWVGACLVFLGQSHRLKMLIPSCAIAVLVGVLNLKYYGALFEFMSGGHSKLANGEIHGVSSSLLMLGRYAFQIFFPYWTSVGDYGFDSWQNLAGLGLLPFFFYLIWKVGGPRKMILAVLGLILLLFPVVWQITQHSGNDTYAVTGSVYLALWSYYLVRSVHSSAPGTSTRKRIFLALCLIFLPAEVAFSREKASVWSDSLLIFKQAYEVEPSFPNQFSYAETLFLEKDFTKSFLIVQDMYELFGMSDHLDGLIARLIFESSEFDDWKKIEYFDRYRLGSRTARILRAMIENRLGHHDLAYKGLSEVVQEPYSLKGVYLNCDWISREWGFACKKIGREDCSSLPARIQEKCGN